MIAKWRELYREAKFWSKPDDSIDVTLPIEARVLRELLSDLEWCEAWINTLAASTAKATDTE